jgi:hypothetical protein
LATPAPTRDDDTVSLSGREDSPSVCQFDASGFTCTLTLSSDQIDQWLQTIRFLKWVETGIIAFSFALMVAPTFLAGPEVGLAAEAFAAFLAAGLSVYESDQWDKVADELKEVPRGESALFTLSHGWGTFEPLTFDNGMGSRSEPITPSWAAAFLAFQYFDFPVLEP